MSPYPGVALQPVMDLTDRRIIAYEAQGRPLDADSRDVVQAAFAATALQLVVPLLVPVPNSLLLDPEFDPSSLARAAHASPAGIVLRIRLDEPDPAVLTLVTALKEQVFRI